VGAYLRPEVLPDALSALAAGAAGGADRGRWVVVAGATDHYPARVGRVVDEDVLDVTAIGGLRGIEVADDGSWRIGALTTWSELAAATELPPLFDGLRAAARTIGGLQIQNRATLAGNLCNASPAADGTPNLLALDAAVELASAAGMRRVPVGEFVVDNRRTVRAPDELVTAVLVPPPLPGTEARSTFVKLGSRAYLVISIAMVAAVVEVGTDGRIARARIAVGACSEVARRLPELESALAGQPLAEATAVAGPEHMTGLAPIDDVRGTAAYRGDAALVLVRRALGALGALEAGAR
jgi:CO/xanthine dehydrogenase FAD-binding subunit